jgi:hypothetical protein
VVNCPQCGKEVVESDIEVKNAYCRFCMKWFAMKDKSIENSSKKMTKEDIIEVIKKNGLFRYNIFNDHPQRANEVLIKQEVDNYIVFTTNEKNKIKGNIFCSLDRKDAIDIFIKQLHELKELYLSTYVGKNYETFYKERLEKKPEKKIYISAIWVPIILGSAWFIYRKMYIEFIIIYVIYTIIDLILSALIEPSNYSWEVIGRSLNIILALIGNSIYRLKIYRVIKKIENIDGEEHISYLKKHGGTNIIMTIIVVVISLVLALIPIIFNK